MSRPLPVVRPTRAQLLRNAEQKAFKDYLEAKAKRQQEQPIEQNLNRGLPVVDDKSRVNIRMLVDDEERSDHSYYCKSAATPPIFSAADHHRQCAPDEHEIVKTSKLISHEPSRVLDLIRNLHSVVVSPLKNKNQKTLKLRDMGIALVDEDHERYIIELAMHFQQQERGQNNNNSNMMMTNRAGLSMAMLSFAHEVYECKYCGVVAAVKTQAVNCAHLFPHEKKNEIIVKNKEMWEKCNLKVLFA